MPWTGQPTVEDLIATLDLKPHQEGGYFRETYRSEVATNAGGQGRPASTAILYLLTTSEPSRFHRLRSDELWFYHAGALAELVMMDSHMGDEDSGVWTKERLPEHKVIGPGSPYVLVPGGWWVAARTVVGDQTDWGTGRAPERRWTADRREAHVPDWTLTSCVVTPGFEYDDFELAQRERLLEEFPLASDLILTLT